MEVLKDNTKNPYWDPIGLNNYGVAYLSMEPILYQLSFEGEIALVCNSELKGSIKVSLQPILYKDRESRDDQKICSPHELLEQ